MRKMVMTKELYFVVVAPPKDWDSNFLDGTIQYVSEDIDDIWDYIEEAFRNDDILNENSFRIIKGSYVPQEQKREKWWEMWEKVVVDEEAKGELYE